MTEHKEVPKPQKTAWTNDSARRHWVNHERRLAISYNAAHEVSKDGPAAPAWEKFPDWLMRGWYDREYVPVAEGV